MTTALQRPADLFPDLVGKQIPHHLWEIGPYEGSEVLGDAAILLARAIENPLFPWQDASIHSMLRRNPATGLWVHPDCCLICPRQNGKSETLLIRCLFGLFVLGERIVFSAQRWPTAKKLAQRMIGIIYSDQSLKSRLAKKPTLSQGMGEIVLESGAQITFLTRSEDSGVGFDELDLVIYDEGYNLTEGNTAALTLAQMASKNPQTIYASSAVNAHRHPNGHVLAAIRRDGLAHAPDLYFAEFMAPDGECDCDACRALGPMDREDEATWIYANPSYGVIQTEAKVRKVMRRFNTVQGRIAFDVGVLGRGVWPRAEDDRDAVITEDQWGDMKIDLDNLPTLTGPVALALDRSFDGRVWALAAAQYTTEQRVHIEIGYVGDVSNAEMLAKITDVVAEWNPVALVIDKKSPAAVLEPLLIAERIAPVMTHAGQMATACQGFLDDALDGQLSHTDQETLTESVLGAAKRTLPQGDFAWDRTAGSVISPLVAVTLARWGLQTFGLNLSEPSAAPAFDDLDEAGGDADRYDLDDDEFDPWEQI
ncbi:terminase large subunit [Gordonia phage DirtyBoi]|nr:terminase large subunit [Gordonia phage DirtyBoi]